MKIKIHTLGCKVNQYDSREIAKAFKDSGHEIVNKDADIHIINSCTVTALADKKTRQLIRSVKRSEPNSFVVATGCYAKTRPAELKKMAECDLVAERFQIKEIPEKLVISPDTGSISSIPCEFNTPGTSAITGDSETPLSFDNNNTLKSNYMLLSKESDNFDFNEKTRYLLKIEDGCDMFCSYCIIPFARGKVKSRPKEEILNEAKSVIKAGYKEIVVIGINSALYGKDIKSSLFEILKNISNIEGDFRIRLGSLEPNAIDPETARNIASIDKICPHFHLSLQSGSDKILKAMKRRYTASEYFKIIENLKCIDKSFAITTDIIVGFPGETEEDFNESVNLVKKAGFLKTHVFPFSKRKGTEAFDFPNQISKEVSKERVKILMDEAEKASRKFLIENIGKKKKILIEETNTDGNPMGYTENYIRTVLFPKKNEILQKGMFHNIEINDILDSSTNKKAGNEQFMKGIVLI